MFKNTFVFGLGNILSALSLFLLLPVLTRYLSPEEMGGIAYFEAILLVLVPLITFGIDGFLSVKYFSFDKQELRVFSRSVIAVPLWTAAIVTLLTIIVLQFDFYIPVPHVGWLIGIGFLGFLQSVAAYVFSYLQMQQRAFMYAFYKVFGALSGVVSAYILVVYFDAGDAGRYVSFYIVGIVLSVIGWLFLMRERVFDSVGNKKHFYAALKFGRGMVIHSWSGIIFYTTDRFILGSMVGPDELGKYAVAAQIGMAMSIVQTTYSQVWTPFIFRKISEGISKIDINKYSFISILGLLAVSLLCAVLVQPFFNWFIDPRFHSMIEVAYWIISSYLFLGFYKVYVVHLFYHEKTLTVAKITASCATINVVLTFFLVEKYGAIGAAEATFISSIIFFLLVFVKANSLIARMDSENANHA